MAISVVMSAQIMCSFGLAPGSLVVVPQGPPVLMENKPAATIMDHVPMMNIMPFGMCTAPTNPAVIAALGAPSACVPVTPAPWVPGSPTVLLGNKPALNNSSKLMCVWAGVIQIVNPGATKEMVP
jgi:hypothetical protein